jgi:plasmid stabilization system protein ParE
VKLEWSAFALSDRDDIFDYIEADSPRSAIRVDEAIANAAERLLDFPESGRPGRVTGTRELVVTGLPYGT